MRYLELVDTVDEKACDHEGADGDNDQRRVRHNEGKLEGCWHD